MKNIIFNQVTYIISLIIFIILIIAVIYNKVPKIVTIDKYEIIKFINDDIKYKVKTDKKYRWSNIPPNIKDYIYKYALDHNYILLNKNIIIAGLEDKSNDLILYLKNME